MRSSERDTLLFLLAISAGSADGWSYFGMGHAFVANMTGNTVLIGLGLFTKGGDVLHPLLALGCYVIGAAAASYLTRKVRQGATWARAITLTLLLEAVIMGCAEAAWIAIHHFGPSAHTDTYLAVLLGWVAFATGLQSGAMLQLKIPGVVTTYITGTWTNLMSGLVRLGTTERRDSPKKKLEFEERLLMQAGILASYFLAAVLTGWFFRHSPLAVGALSAASVWAVALYAAFRGERAAREP